MRSSDSESGFVSVVLLPTSSPYFEYLQIYNSSRKD